MELTYKFQLAASEPDNLLFEILRVVCTIVFRSRMRPSQRRRAVEPAHPQRLKLEMEASRKAKNAICAEVPDETKENKEDLTLALAEADWAMMEVVVAHWRPEDLYAYRADRRDFSPRRDLLRDRRRGAVKRRLSGQM